MAEPHEQHDRASEAGFFAAAGKLLTSFRETVNPVIESVSEPILRDGLVGSAFRMGVDELYLGLKAFPDTIQAVAPGGLMNPLQTEIADARKEPTLDDMRGSQPQPQLQQSQEKDQGYGL